MCKSCNVIYLMLSKMCETQQVPETWLDETSFWSPPLTIPTVQVDKIGFQSFYFWDCHCDGTLARQKCSEVLPVYFTNETIAPPACKKLYEDDNKVQTLSFLFWAI